MTTATRPRPARRSPRPPHRAISASLATPGVRCLVVEVWADPEKPDRYDVASYSVLAIRTTVYDDGHLEDDALIVHPAWPGLTEARLACDEQTTAWELLAAPWDPASDAVQLDPIIDRLKRAARKLVAEAPT
jgi:hypothetical protein